MSVFLSFESNPNRRGCLARLRLARPEASNALRPQDWQLLSTHLDDIARHPQTRAVLVEAEGKAFCAGGDLKTMPERLALPHDVRYEQLLGNAQVILKLRSLDIPVVASIQGACMGAGLALALACDLRVAASVATFKAPFHRVGLSCDFGSSRLLVETVGLSRAMHLLFTEAVLSASEALAFGLVSEVVADSDLAARVHGLCANLLHGPGQAHAATKRAVYAALGSDLGATIAREAQSQSTLSKTRDAEEGVRAFLEKRAPQFAD